MELKGSHLASCIETSQDDSLVVRFRIPLVPALLGALAVLNIASAIMVLME